MHRLIIAVAAVFLMALSIAKAESKVIEKKSDIKANKILLEGKILHASYIHKSKRYRSDIQYHFVVGFKGRVFNCYLDNVFHELGCEGSYAVPATIRFWNKKN